MSTRALREGTDGTLLERLAEAGFLASECGMHARAEEMLSDLVAARPEIAASSAVLAIVRARSGQLERAIDELREFVDGRSDADIATAVLGMLMVQAGRAEAATFLRQVIERDGDSRAVGIANACLALVEGEESAVREHGDSDEFSRHMNLRP